MSLLGIDIGTTGCKAAAFSLEGTIIGQSYREYEVLYPAAATRNSIAPACLIGCGK